MNKRQITILTAAHIIAFGGMDVMAMSSKFPLNITAEAKEDTAIIRISGVINNWQNSAEEFKRQVDGILAQGIKNVKLYINTPGGSVFEANEIANEITRFEGTISGYGGALVASAGTYISLICDTFEQVKNGQYMWHKPMANITGNEDRVIADLKLLQNLTTLYRTAYSEKTGLSEDEIESRWSKGDQWLSAQEALEQKFITAVSPSKAKVTEDQKALFVACGAPHIPNVNSQRPTTMKNKNELIAKLRLSADATDEQILDAASKAVTMADTVQTLQDAQASNLKKQAEALVDKAIITDKKITADLRDQYVKFAMSDLEGTTAILAAMPGIEKPSGSFTPGSTATGREAWTLEEYQAKDPKALEKMMIDDPTAFAKLEEAYFS